MDLVLSLLGKENGGRYVVYDHLDDSDRFLEASGSGDDGTDGLLTLWSTFKDVVGDSGGDSNKLYMVVNGKANLWN